MSYIKRRIDEIDFNDSKTMAEILLSLITDEQVTKVLELCGDKFDEMYDNWVKLHGIQIANKWVDDNGGFITGWDEIEEFAQSLVTSFIKYLEP